jgi:hypothetical protein
MRTHNPGYPRIGARRELKRACGNYRAGRISLAELQQAGKQIRHDNRKIHQSRLSSTLIHFESAGSSDPPKKHGNIPL